MRQIYARVLQAGMMGIITLPQEKSLDFFPSASAAGVLVEKLFNSNIIDNLKLRAHGEIIRCF